jgi:hypothetical protein
LRRACRKKQSSTLRSAGCGFRGLPCSRRLRRCATSSNGGSLRARSPRSQSAFLKHRFFPLIYGFTLGMDTLLQRGAPADLSAH